MRSAAARLLLAAVGGLALARLTWGPPAWTALLVTALAGAGVGMLVVRRRGRAAAMVAGSAAVLLAALWVSLGRATWHGVPTAATVRALHLALVGARPDLAGLHAPFPSVHGVVFLGAVLAGVAGVAVAVLPGAWALAPAAALVAASTVALPSTGAAVLGVVAVAGALALLWAPGPGRRAGLAVAAVVLAAGAGCAVLVPAAASDGGGVVGTGPPAVAPDALSLLTDLTGLQARDPDLVLFTASTPYPTYWQVTALTRLVGNEWEPDPATLGVVDGTAPPLPEGAPDIAGTGSFDARVTVGAYSGRLLPAPPTALAVQGVTAVPTDAGFATPTATRPGQHFVVTSEISSGTEAGPPVTTASLASATALPPEPAVVARLAAAVTGRYSDPLQKAEALTAWFRSGRFHYSLTTAPHSLVDFLTTSRTGSCQQFAGAFTLLARAAGLPARVAVGFTNGHLEPGGLTAVRGIDAHAWPQVDISGVWVSFEPTPERPSGELAPSGILGPSGLGTANPAGTQPPAAHVVPPRTVPTEPPTTVPVTVARPGGRTWWALPAAVVLVAAVAVAALVARRRRRRALPVPRIRAAWDRVERALRRAGRGRPPWRTPSAHAASLAAAEPSDEQVTAALADLARLAALVEAATYAGTALTPAQAARAEAAARAVGRTLRRRHALAPEDTARQDAAAAGSPRR